MGRQAIRCSHGPGRQRRYLNVNITQQHRRPATNVGTTEPETNSMVALGDLVGDGIPGKSSSATGTHVYAWKGRRFLPCRAASSHRFRCDRRPLRSVTSTAMASRLSLLLGHLY